MLKSNYELLERTFLCFSILSKSFNVAFLLSEILMSKFGLLDSKYFE